MARQPHYVSANGWFPSARLGTPLQAKLCFARASFIYCAMRPKQKLGNEGKGGLFRPLVRGARPTLTLNLEL
jgi:hypothetical protein